MFLIRFLIQTVKQTLQNIKKKKYQHLLFLQNKRSRVNTIKASFLHDFMNKIAEAFRTVEKRKFAEERGKDLKTMSSEIIFDSNL
jgi:macrodomain Ter protein organizer (MatP/YcbG family)